jgi:hypothetical protein
MIEGDQEVGVYLKTPVRNEVLSCVDQQAFFVMLPARERECLYD